MNPASRDAQRGFVFSALVESRPFFLLVLALSPALPAPAHADCQQQLQLLATDLKDVALTETQKQDLGGLVDDARRYCWIHQERPAMVYIAKARRVVGLRPPPDELDWETIPLESLEQR